MAIRHPDRVRTMCSIMSTTGNPEMGQAEPEAMAVLLAPSPATREEAIEMAVLASRVIGSKVYPVDDAVARARAAATYDRSNYPEGMARQLIGIVATGDRTEGLTKVTVPTVVIHGADDPLVGLSGGEATAAAIPGAKLVVLPGMGHDLPEPLWPQIIDAIVENARRG
jgi:pimeloyl-ACP methyl ester carboxylesterase